MNAHRLAFGEAPVLDAPKGERRDCLASIERETLREGIYAELRRSMIHGGFEAGEVVRIVELAQRLRTGAMPVREVATQDITHSISLIRARLHEEAAA